MTMKTMKEMKTIKTEKMEATMKKRMSVLLLLIMVLALAAGCSSKGATLPDDKRLQEKEEAAAPVAIDIDLTALSSTMVYAEVYNMVTTPADYMGKTIKMGGMYNSSFYAETGKDYHFVLINDATSCCATGLEFIWNGEHKYPNDYPAPQTEIEVVGVFGSYDELGITYYYLAVDNIKKA